MRLHLSEDDAALQRELRDFFTNEFPASIREKVRNGIEVSPEESRETQRVLNSAGFAVPNWPVEWGGKDWSPLQHHIWHEEMRLAHIPNLLPFNTSMVGPVIAAFGSREQKERFLPPTANLDIWWCQGFSEPDAGSDLASLRTTAVREGDEWVVNGQKTWTTLGQHADWIFCLVRTNPDAAKRQQGISFLVFEMSAPGVTIRPIKLIDGGHEVNEIFFDNVRVPADQLIGEENRGWDYAKFLLGNERTGVAPVGLTKNWLQAAKKQASQPLADGTRPIDDAVIAARFASLENRLVALELTAIRVAGNSKDGKPDPASSVLKLHGTELQQEVTQLIVDLAGPAGAASGASESDVPAWARASVPHYLNFRKASIYGGSNEVQRTIIAGSILGL